MIFLLNPIPSDIWRPHFLFTGTDSQSLVGGGEVGGAVRTLIIRQSYNNRDFATFLLSELHGYNIFTSVIKFTICEQRWKGPQWLKIRRQVWRRFQKKCITILWVTGRRGMCFPWTHRSQRVKGHHNILETNLSLGRNFRSEMKLNRASFA